jgi:hypothetical protein
MTTDLDDLLALLPDNNSGQITASDLRTITATLWSHTWVGEQYPYVFTTAATPAAGAVGATPWTTAITAIPIWDQATDNTNLGVGRLDTAGTLVRIRSSATVVLIAQIAGPATVNAAGWRTLKVTGVSAIGVPPADKSKVTVTLLGEYTR